MSGKKIPPFLGLSEEWSYEMRVKDEQIEALRHHIAALTAQRDELLDALKEVVRISDRKHDAWDKAKAAIAKAEGRIP
jgi:hypothetical protein